MYETSIWTILTAIGTLSAVIVALIIALFGEKIRNLIFAPKIEISIKDPKGELIHNITDKDGNIIESKKSRYYHLIVSNKNRNDAHDTQVYVNKIEDFYGPSRNKRTLWEGEIPLNWIDQAFKSYHLTIGPPEICDLVCISGEKLYILTLYYKNNFKGVWNGESYFIISLYAKYKEGISKTFKFLIDWDGKWNDGEKEMSDHFKIEEK